MLYFIERSDREDAIGAYTHRSCDIFDIDTFKPDYHLLQLVGPHAVLTCVLLDVPKQNLSKRGMDLLTGLMKTVSAHRKGVELWEQK